MYAIKEINDKETWESFLSTASFYPFFQSWNWGEVQKKLGFPIKRIGLYDKRGKLLGVCLIVEVLARRGHYFHLRHGPILMSYKQEYLDIFFSYLYKEAKRKNVSFLRISPLVLPEILRGYAKHYHFINAPIHNMDAEVCWVLDITKQEETLLKEMRKSHRYLIRKVENMDIKITRTTKIDDINRFIPLYKQLSQLKHFVPHKGVREEFEIFAKDDQMVLYLVEYQEQIIAGSLIAFVGNMAIYRHSASDKRFNHLSASYLIQWEAIKEAKRRGMQVYNFWGIAPSDKQNHPWQGLTLFKTGFGGERKEFMHAQDVPLNLLYWKTYLIESFTKKLKGY